MKSQLASVRATLPELRRAGGSVVLTVSTSGFYPGRGGVLYVASKFAVRGCVIALAHELAPEVRVNGIGPRGQLRVPGLGPRPRDHRHRGAHRRRRRRQIAADGRQDVAADRGGGRAALGEPFAAAQQAEHGGRDALSRSSASLVSGFAFTPAPRPPAQATTITTRWPSAASRASVPPVNSTSSSGWAWKARIVATAVILALAARLGEGSADNAIRAVRPAGLRHFRTPGSACSSHHPSACLQ